MENEKQQSVEMTAEELAAFEQFKAEKAKREADEHLKQLRTSYDSLREDFIKSTFKKLAPLSEKIRQQKADVLEEFKALQGIKSELLGLEGKEMPKSHTFTNKANTKCVTIGVYETDGYDDTVEEGIAIVKECIEARAKDENSAQLVKMVMGLLARSANGALKASRVVRLHKLAEESGDPRFVEGVRIIEDSYRPNISRTYVRCSYRKVDKETGVVGDWEALPLGMTES